MNTYTQDDLRNGVAQYLGLGTFPQGNATAYDSSLQSAIDYCWRFTEWPFTIKRDVELTPDENGTYYMPENFDILGWRSFKSVPEYSTKDAVEFEEQNHITVRGVYLEYDTSNNRYQIKGDTGSLTTVSYKVLPEKISTGAIHFIAHQPIVMAASIYQKMKEHPDSADVRQEWNMLDMLLAQMASQSNRNTPLHKPKDRYDKYGTYFGDTRG